MNLRVGGYKFTYPLFLNKKTPRITRCFLEYTYLAIFLSLAGLSEDGLCALGSFTFTSLAAVLKHEVQTLSFMSSIFLVCKLMSCLFKVLILEWERVAPFLEPRPHKSQVFPIFVVYLSRPLT